MIDWTHAIAFGAAALASPVVVEVVRARATRKEKAEAAPVAVEVATIEAKTERVVSADTTINNALANAFKRIEDIEKRNDEREKVCTQQIAALFAQIAQMREAHAAQLEALRKERDRFARDLASVKSELESMIPPPI